MNTNAAVARALMGPGGASLELSGLSVASKRPYINSRGESVVVVNTGQLDNEGQPVYREQKIAINATLRKDEWRRIDDQVLEAFRERLVIVDDIRAAGLVHPVGGLGVLISEWEKSSEITDAELSMDGESQVDQDRQEFGINGVPIPVIQKPFRISERVLLASRTRGAGLDVSTGLEAARAVARTSEKLVFFGSNIGNQTIDGQNYAISGLTNFANRALASMGDWSSGTFTPEQILADILNFVRIMETQERRFGPFTVYVPGAYAWRFRQDFKALGERTLMERVMAEPAIAAVRFSDVLPAGQVLMVQLTSDVLDLAMASDVSTIQWASPSGWTNFFQVFAAWAPRLKSDFDGHSGILHATVGT